MNDTGTFRSFNLTYTGNYENGFRNGKGIMANLHTSEKYEGDWKEDYTHGKGTLTGNEYEKCKEENCEDSHIPCLNSVYVGDFK